MSRSGLKRGSRKYQESQVFQALQAPLQAIPSSTKGAAIGAGVGVPVGLIALAGLGYLFWRHRRREKQQAIELQSGQQNRFGATSDYAYHDGNNPPIHEVEAVPARRTSKKGFLGMRNMNLRRRSRHRNYQVRIRLMKWLEDYIVLINIGDFCHRYA
jgi:hypothetical protein